MRSSIFFASIFFGSFFFFDSLAFGIATIMSPICRYG